MFKEEDAMPKGAFGNFREVQARRRQRRRTDRQSAEVAKILVAYDRRCAGGCDRAVFGEMVGEVFPQLGPCLLYTSPSPRDATLSRMPSSA